MQIISYLQPCSNFITFKITLQTDKSEIDKTWHDKKPSKPFSYNIATPCQQHQKPQHPLTAWQDAKKSHTMLSTV